jgi:hypothetical protein
MGVLLALEVVAKESLHKPLLSFSHFPKKGGNRVNIKNIENNRESLVNSLQNRKYELFRNHTQCI